MNPKSGFRQLEEEYDLVVAGGGMAGLCCAIQGAREGMRTCLIQDRPVLGGVSSSEMRVTVHGSACHHAYGRETGIVSEMIIDERTRNHETINENGWTNSVWDMVLYDWAMKEEQLTLKLNSQVIDLIYDNGQRAWDLESQRPDVDHALGYSVRPACPASPKIQALVAVVGNSQTQLLVKGRNFVDCTGDAIVADLAGCEWRWGSESREQTGETHAPEQASSDVMGNSIHIRCRDTGAEAPYRAPEWAVKHEDASYFYDQGRVPHDPRGGFWWIEIGVPYNTIYENEDIRHELTRHALGVWDWMKNKDPEMMDLCRNYALEFIGQVPGKRENRRVMGQTLMTEHDIQAKKRFKDEVAYGGWFLDLHTPGGLLADSSEPHAAEGYSATSEYSNSSYVGPYGIPLGSLVSKDVENLAMAGRNVSVTHAALGTVRVMGTTSLMGQALGCAIAEAQREGVAVKDLSLPALGRVQQKLLKDGCFLPNIERQDPADLAPLAKVTATSTQLVHGTVLGSPAEEKDLPLDAEFAQLIPVDGGKVDGLSFHIKTDKATRVHLRLHGPSHIWDYEMNKALLFETDLEVPSGGGWVSCEPKLDLKGAKGFLFCHLEAQEGVTLPMRSVSVPGAFLHARTSPTRTKSKMRMSMEMAIDPPQDVLGAEQVLQGPTRPSQLPHQWMGEARLPQSLVLTWPQAVETSSLQLTFPGHLLKEYHATAPFSVDPVIIRDFDIEGLVQGQWLPLAKCEGNVQRQVRCSWSTCQVTSLRVNVRSTHGSPFPRIAEIRVYP